MDRKILVLSPNLELHGGNLVTLSRIRNHLEIYGYTCELSSPVAFPDHESFRRKAQIENVKMLIGIHAYKTGIFMKDCVLPYILIIGGTDVHEFAKDPQKLNAMTDVVCNARYVVCFSPELKKKTIQLWPELQDKRVKIIPQGIEILLSSESITEDVIKKKLLQLEEFRNKELPVSFRDSTVKPLVFALIGGIRPVKNPLYLVSAFQEWHARDERVWLLVVGQVLDRTYTETQFLPAINRQPGVLFIPGATLLEAHAIIKQSFVVVNSSNNEGMCLAILEAMMLEVPVLARDNLGNRSIIDEGNTGLIFTSPEAFVTKAMWMIDHPEKCAKIISKAKDFVLTNHRLDIEKDIYISMVKQCMMNCPSNDVNLVQEVVIVGSGHPDDEYDIDDSDDKIR